MSTSNLSTSSSSSSNSSSSGASTTDDAFQDRLATMLDPKRVNKVLEKRDKQELRDQQREQKKHKKVKHTSLKVVAPALLASLAALPSPISSSPSSSSSPTSPTTPGSPSTTATNTGASLAKVFQSNGGAGGLERELQEKRAARSKVFGVPLEQLLLKEKTHIVDICRRDGDTLASTSSPSLISTDQSPMVPRATLSGSSIQLEASTSDELESLKDQREKEQGLRCPIPFIVFLTVEYIRSHGLCESGLFRLAGHHGKQTKAEEALDSGETLGTEVLDGLDIHTVAAILKSFLRQLPNPVIPRKPYFRVLNWAAGIPDTHPQKVNLYASIIAAVPAQNRALLQYLCGFFHEVIANTEHNRMNVENLAIIFGPSFLGEIGGENDTLSFSGVTKTAVLEQMQLLNNITAFLICNFDAIFRANDVKPIQHYRATESYVGDWSKYEGTLIKGEELYLFRDGAMDSATMPVSMPTTKLPPGPTIAVGGPSAAAPPGRHAGPSPPISREPSASVSATPSPMSSPRDSTPSSDSLPTANPAIPSSCKHAVWCLIDGNIRLLPKSQLPNLQLLPFAPPPRLRSVRSSGDVNRLESLETRESTQPPKRSHKRMKSIDNSLLASIHPRLSLFGSSSSDSSSSSSSSSSSLDGSSNGNVSPSASSPARSVLKQFSSPKSDRKDWKQKRKDSKDT